MSSGSHRARMIALHRAPANISRDEFQKRYTALAKSFAALPIVRKHVLKYEVCFANERFDEHIRAIHLRTSELFAVAICETENHETLTEIMRDPKFRMVMQDAEFLDHTAGGTFTVDIVNFIDRDS